MLTAALFTTAKTWKQPECPSTEEWIKMWHIYTAGYYSAIKKDEIMPSAAPWMAEECHTTEEKHCVASLIYLVPCLSLFPGVCSTHVSRVGDAIQPSPLNQLFIIKVHWWDFTGCPVKTSSSNAAGVALIPGLGAKIPHILQPKNQNVNNRSNIVTNSIEM